MPNQLTEANSSDRAELPSYLAPIIDDPRQARDMLTAYGVKHADLDWGEARYFADHVVICWRSVSRPRSQYFIPFHPELDLDSRLRIAFLLRAIGLNWNEFVAEYTPIWYDTGDLDWADREWWHDLEQWIVWLIDLPGDPEPKLRQLNWPATRSTKAGLRLSPGLELDLDIAAGAQDIPKLTRYGTEQLGIKPQWADCFARETLLYWPEVSDPRSQYYIPFPDKLPIETRQWIAYRLLRLQMTWPEFVRRIGGEQGELPIAWEDVEECLRRMTPIVVSAAAMLYFLSGGIQSD